MSGRRLLPALACAAALPLLAAGTARADFFGGDVIDGPSPDIRSVGDVDVARDGSSAVAYLRRDGGVDHAFVARLVDGRWQTPERVDPGLDGGPATQPVVTASDNGRVIAAYVNAGTLYAVVRPAADQAWLPPQPIATGATNPSIDMSINGGAYLTFTLAGDVRVARVDRKDVSFHVLDAPLDVDPARLAGTGTGRSRVAVSADGTAVAVWGEGGHVFGRRIFFDKVSDAPQDLNVEEIDGHHGAEADLPTIDIEDDSSFAWATFRERFEDGAYHVVAKRLVGSLFQNETLVDGIPFGSGDSAVSTAVELNGRGEGIALTGTAQKGVAASLLHDDKFFTPAILDPGNTVDPQPFGGRDEVDDAFAFWIEGASPAAAAVHALSYQIKPNLRTVPSPGASTQLSDPAQGAVDLSAGFDGGVNRAGDAIAVSVQDGAAGRRLVSDGFDRPPGAFRGYSTTKYRKYQRPPLVWGSSFELWGPVTYTVKVDGQPVGQTQDRRLKPLQRIPDGVHTWQVVATDLRGQTRTSPSRTLRVDATPPEVTFKVSRKGRLVRVTARAADGSLARPAGSGVKAVKIAFGDGTTVTGRKASHRYGRGGAFTVRVSATDKAGNAVAVSRRIHVKR